MSALLMLSPAPVVELPGREVLLDVDFVEGMKLHCQFWPGRVCCVLRRGAVSIPGGRRYSRRRLGFDLVLLDPDEPLPEVLIDEANLVYCSADDAQYLRLPQLINGRLTRLVYTLENAPGLRLASVLGDRHCSLWRRLRSALWVLRNESELRAAIRAADGVQFNGFAAQRAYRRLHRNSLFYLHSRMRTPMLARAADQQARAERLRDGAPLRLVFVGPLERASGAFDLLQMAYLLKAHGVDFRLEMFGEGTLDGRLRDGIAALDLGAQMTLAESPGFDVALVPHLRNALTATMNPLKIYNYLAARKPVVSTEIENVDPALCPFISFASDAGGFAAAIRAACRARPPDGPAFEAAIAGISWEARAQAILARIDAWQGRT